MAALAHQAALVIEEARMVEEKQALVQQIQQQVSRIERIMDAIPEGVILLNNQRRVIQVNALGREYLKYLGNANVGEVLYSLNAVPIQTLLRLPNHASHNKVNITVEGHRHLEICACPIYDNEDNSMDEETTEERATSDAAPAVEPQPPDEWVVLVRDISAYVASQPEEESPPIPSLAQFASQVASSIARSLRNDPLR